MIDNETNCLLDKRFLGSINITNKSHILPKSTLKGFNKENIKSFLYNFISKANLGFLGATYPEDVMDDNESLDAFIIRIKEKIKNLI